MGSESLATNWAMVAYEECIGAKKRSSILARPRGLAQFRSRKPLYMSRARTVLDRQSRTIVASNCFTSDDQCYLPYGAGIAAVCELLHSALFGRSNRGERTGCKNKPSLSAELARDRRRGDRLAATAHSRLWHSTDVLCVPTNVCSWWKSGRAADITSKTGFVPQRTSPLLSGCKMPVERN